MGNRRCGDDHGVGLRGHRLGVGQGAQAELRSDLLPPADMVVVDARASRPRQLRGHTGVLAVMSRLSELSAVPLGVLFAAAIYLQAIFGVVTVGPKDPTARMLGAGWTQLAAQIDQIRARVQAPVILTTDYEVAGWLSFYLPSHTPVHQVNQRIRWANEPTPDAGLFAGQILYVCKVECGRLDEIQHRFATVELLGTLSRTRGDIQIERYSVYRVAGPTAPTLDPLYAELADGRTP